MRRLLIGALVLATLGLGSACGEVAKDEDTVLAAINRTEQVARTFTYAERAAGSTTIVQGAIRDDMSFRLDALIDGKPAASEIVADDTRAVLIDSSTGQPVLIPRVGSGSGSTSPLQTGVWLVDPVGAASLNVQPPPQQPGSDVFIDSLTALEYVRRAVSAAQTVQLYNPQSENYQPRLDIFPKPATGELRYDLIPPDLPARQRIGSSGNTGLQNQVPGVPFFRLMAVYVRNGLVDDVREQIAVLPRLNDPQSNLEDRLGDFTKAVSASSPPNVQAAALLFSINRLLSLEGQPLIRPRQLDLRFTSLGHAPAPVIPATATPADLSALGTYGLVLFESN